MILTLRQPSHGYTSLGAEFKDRISFSGEAMVAVTNKVANFSICLLIGSNLAVWQKKTIEKFNPDVSVYRMTEKHSIKRLSGPNHMRKVLIALDLEKLHPGRYARLPHSF
jgi:hypothetical protein